MLSKNEIALAIEEKTGVKPNLVKTVLDGLAEVAQEEITAGNDFTIPKVVKVHYAYRSPRKKGEMYDTGDTVQGVGGAERVADAPSPARKASVKLKAVPTAHVKRHMPKSNDAAGQSAFLRSKAGKAVVSRKS